jgi:NAD-dependent dihydropyrimidine dehydrogenase PreA subunit
MITIDTERCTGCGECLDACPTGAITMQNQVAFVDEEYCQECEVCLDLCPEGAILSAEIVEPVPVLEPAGAIQRQTADEPVSLRQLALPVIGSALYWAGREMAPRLISLALDSLDRRMQSGGPTPDLGIGRGRTSGSGRRQGRRRRRRYRNRTITLAEHERR